MLLWCRIFSKTAQDQHSTLVCIITPYNIIRTWPGIPSMYWVVSVCYVLPLQFKNQQKIVFIYLFIFIFIFSYFFILYNLSYVFCNLLLSSSCQSPLLQVVIITFLPYLHILVSLLLPIFYLSFSSSSSSSSSFFFPSSFNPVFIILFFHYPFCLLHGTRFQKRTI